MKLNALRTGGLLFALFFAVGCGGPTGEVPTAPSSSSSGPTAPAGEKKAGDVKSMAPADAAEKYK